MCATNRSSCAIHTLTLCHVQFSTRTPINGEALRHEVGVGLPLNSLEIGELDCFSQERLGIDAAIGRRVRELRLAADKCVEDVAAKTAIPTAEYVQAERGERRFRAVELFGIAKCLDIRMRDIMAAV